MDDDDEDVDVTDSAERADQRPEVESDHSADFVSLLSLLSIYFDDSHFQQDSIAPRILSPSTPLQALPTHPLGHGRLFTVTSLSSGDHVWAIKRPRRDEAEYSELLRAILVEIRVSTLPPLKPHENICNLVGYGWDRRADWPLPFLIQEYCEHGTLSEFLAGRQQCLPLAQKNDLILDTALGIAALHTVGIVHCDIRCENILIRGHADRGFIAKIAGFGSALTDVHDQRLKQGSGLPATSSPCCAPEAYQHVKLPDTKPLDIYALGIVGLFVLLDGRSPFDILLAKLMAQRDLSGLPIAEDVQQLLTNGNADPRERTISLKKRGLTESLMLWLFDREDLNGAAAATKARVLIKLTLRNDPSTRDLGLVLQYFAAACGRSAGDLSDSVQSSLCHDKESPRSDDIGALYKRFEWCSYFLGVDLPEEAFPLAVYRKYIFDLEARAARVPAVQYMTSLANCHLHGIGSGSRKPQRAGLAWLRAEARRFGNRDGMFPWFRVQRYHEALGEPLPPEFVDISQNDILRSAALTGGIVPALILREEDPDLYEEIRQDIRFELKGVKRDIVRMASNVEDVARIIREQLGEHDAFHPRPQIEGMPDNKRRLLEDAIEAWQEEAGNHGETKETMLHAAAAHGCIDLVSYIIDSGLIAIDARNEDGESPLFQACRAGHLAVVQLLVREGADVKIANNAGETCLHWAPAFAESLVPEFVQLLMSKGANLHAMCGANATASCQSFERSYCPGSPLHRAVFMRAKHAVVSLLRCGADPLLEGPEWDPSAATLVVWIGTWRRESISPIMLACKLAFADMLELLLDAAPSAATEFNPSGDSLICVVDEDPYYGYYLHGASYSMTVQSVVALLQERGADFTQAVSSPRLQKPLRLSALAFAAKLNRLDLLKALLPFTDKEELNAFTQFSLAPEKWYTPLHHALKHGNEELLQLLLENGASCQETQVSIGRERDAWMGEHGTYLGYCVDHPNGIAMAELLVKHGAAVDLGDPTALTPLFQAIVASHFELADFLISKGADVHRRLGGKNLLWFLLDRMEDASNQQLNYTLGKMGTGWDTFIVDAEADLSVFMSVTIAHSRHSMASNTLRRIMQLLLGRFSEPKHVDHQARIGAVSALNIAVAEADTDVCEILLKAGAARSDQIWSSTLMFATQKIKDPVPDAVRDAGEQSVEAYKQGRILIAEMLLPAGETCFVTGQDGDCQSILLVGKGTRRGSPK